MNKTDIEDRLQEDKKTNGSQSNLQNINLQKPLEANEQYPWLTPGYNKTVKPVILEQVNEQTPSITILPPVKPPSFFGGSTGAAHIPQTVDPGKPLPSTNSNQTQLVDRFEEVESKPETNITSNFDRPPDKIEDTTGQTPSITILPPDPCPSFWGGCKQNGTMSQSVEPGKPADHPQGNKTQLDNRNEEENMNQPANSHNLPEGTNLENYKPPSKYPWLTPGYNKTKVPDKFEEVIDDTPTIPITPPDPCPSFWGGCKGNGTIPETVEPGKPLVHPQGNKTQLNDRNEEDPSTNIPNHPEETNLENYKPTSKNPLLIPGYNNSKLPEKFEEVTDDTPTIPITPPDPCPSYWGGCNGNISTPPTIPPGKPWPSRPEDYKNSTTGYNKWQFDIRFDDNSTVVSTTPQLEATSVLHNRMKLGEHSIQQQDEPKTKLPAGCNRTIPENQSKSGDDKLQFDIRFDDSGSGCRSAKPATTMAPNVSQPVVLFNRIKPEEDDDQDLNMRKEEKEKQKCSASGPSQIVHRLQVPVGLPSSLK